MDSLMCEEAFNAKLAAKALIRLSLAQSGMSFHFSPFVLKLM